MKRTGIDAPAQTEILSHLGRRKWKIAEINGVRCLTLMNSMMGRLTNRKWRGLLGRYILGVKEEEGFEFYPLLTETTSTSSLS